jgi:hypothetical protein
MRLFASAAMAMACSFGCFGCSTTSTPPTSTEDFATTPLGTVVSTSGTYVVTVYGPAQGLVQGVNAVELVITDAQSMGPVDGLVVTVVPWMPAMGHGSSAVPVIQPKGAGTYVVTDVSLVMAGTWQLRASVASDDTAVVTVEIS